MNEPHSQTNNKTKRIKIKIAVRNVRTQTKTQKPLRFKPKSTDLGVYSGRRGPETPVCAVRWTVCALLSGWLFPFHQIEMQDEWWKRRVLRGRSVFSVCVCCPDRFSAFRSRNNRKHRQRRVVNYINVWFGRLGIENEYEFVWRQKRDS